MGMGCLSFPRDLSQHHHLRAQSPRTKRVEAGMATFTSTPSVTHWGVLCFLALQPRAQLELPQETVRVSLNYKLQLIPATLASCAPGTSRQEEASLSCGAGRPRHQEMENSVWPASDPGGPLLVLLCPIVMVKWDRAVATA